MKSIFNYTASTRKQGDLHIGDIVIVTMSSMPENHSRAVWLMSDFAYKSNYIETMYSPICLFRVKTLKPPSYDHIPGF